MAITVQVQKTAVFEQKLAVLKQVLGGAAIDAVLLAAAQPVVNRAKEKAPFLTGTLRRSIRAEVRGGGRDASGRFTAQGVFVGTDVPYGARIEFGFVGTDSRGRRYNQGPRPYLRPAIDETTQEVLAAGAAALKVLVSSLP